MTTIVVLPHEILCPNGDVIEAQPGQSVCDALLEHHIDIEHACEKSCACTTCHVIVMEGYESMSPPDEQEEDLLDKAWCLTACSRLSCQSIIAAAPLTIEIPKYTINLAREYAPVTEKKGE